MLDVFMIDMGTYRGPNGDNVEPAAGGQAAFLGADQLAWLKRELVSSKATWKVIAADKKGFEGVSNNEPGKPLGRELEFAELLRFMKSANVKNTVWLTADVRYTAAHFYDLNMAAFQDFDPFWEFVSGPIHAGSFGPNEVDNTFGPQVKYVKAPAPEQVKPGPAAGLQFFGYVKMAAS